MENPLRNEVTLVLADEDRTMRATFAAIMAIEKALGKSMTAIITQLGSGDMSVTDAATIIYHGLRGYDDKRLSFEQVGDAVVEAGMSKVSLSVVDFVMKALSGVSVGKPKQPETAQ